MAKILVIAESHQGAMVPATLVAIAAAQRLGSGCDILYAADVDALSSVWASWEGVHKVRVLLHPRLVHIVAEDLAPVIVAMASEYTHILAAATTFGKNLLPRVAALLNVSPISDVVAIESESQYVRPIYAGNALQRVRSEDKIHVLTIRPTAFDPVQAAVTAASVESVAFPMNSDERIEFYSEEVPTLTRPELSAARIIVSGGRGLKSAEHFKIIESIADKLGAAVGATRAAVDAGWVPNDWQVGQTGKVVAPTLYMAIGISGAIQHIAGMKDSKIIVAINKDPDAPIFQIANYGLVGDLFEILPEFEKML